MINRLLVGVPLLCTVTAAAWPQPHREVSAHTAYLLESPGYVRHAVVVLPHEFDDDAVMTLAREFVARFKGVPFATMYIGTESNSVMTYPFQSPHHIEVWYKAARRAVEEGSAPPRHLAEVNILGQDAVVRIRSNGKVRRLPVSGTDPLRFRVGSSQCEILEYFARSKIPRAEPVYEERCADCVNWIDVFVRCRPALDLSYEVAIRKVFESRAPQADISVVVRPDHYFQVASDDFPMLYAFEETVRVPTPAELNRRPKGFSVLIRRKGGKPR